MRTKTKTLFLILLLAAACRPFELSHLTVEYATEPNGVDVASPRFGWQMLTGRKGAAQQNWKIVVKDEEGRVMWDSGEVSGSRSLGIPYAGKPLAPRSRYGWTVTVTDDKGKKLSQSSFFETSLMSDSDTDPAWHNARWIGGDASAMPFEPQYLSVFRLKFTVDSDGPASFIYGARDWRLGEDSAIRLEFSDRQLTVFRTGYPGEDASFAFDIPLRKGPRCVELSSVSGETEIVVDGKTIVGNLNLNPAGRGGDYTAYPELADIGFAAPEGVTAHFSGIEVLNYRLPRHTLASVPDLTVSGETRLMELPRTGMTQLRRVFMVGKAVKKARIYATARGVYDLYLNGKRVSEDFLNPGLTQYNKTQYYQIFDVTPDISEGENTLGAVLGEGWWSGALTFSPENWNYWGDRQAFLGQLILTYEDGSEEVIVSDSSWQWSNDGPWRYGSIFQGEIYDAGREGNGSWSPAVEVPLEDIVSHEPARRGFMSWPTVDDFSAFRLVAQLGLPVREYQRLKAESAREAGKDTFIYDMGQNMPGVPCITFRDLKPGTVVKVRFAEVLYPDLPEYKGKAGQMMLENLRSAMAQDIFIAAGGEETFQPRFTYHGYRYVEIEGIDHPLPLDDVEGVVFSTIDRITMDYQSDNALLNRFVENVKWSSLANVFSVPTDCPQRNERMGWNGDLSVFCPALSYVFEGPAFLQRHLQALRDNINAEGVYPAIAPVGGGFGGTLWESVGIIMPWQDYLQYNDLESLREHYPSMVRYMEHVLSIIDSDGDNAWRGAPGSLGDWLGFEVQKNENPLIFDCYLVYELTILGKMAEALGEDSARWKESCSQRKAFIAEHYFDAEGVSQRLNGDKVDAQTSYAVALALDVLDEPLKGKVLQQLVRVVETPGPGDDGTEYPAYSLMTGFIGTPWINFALSDNGRADLAYRMILNESFPSWLYPVTQGATTIWERLNSMTAEDGFGGNNSMNSFNHYAFGSVMDWMMGRSLGIDQDEKDPGFHHFILRPVPDPTRTLGQASGHYDSPYGRICSAWKRSGNVIKYDFTVPANTSATLILPGEEPRELAAGKYSFKLKEN